MKRKGATHKSPLRPERAAGGFFHGKRYLRKRRISRIFRRGGGPIADGQIQPGGLFYDALFVGKGVKAAAAMVLAHAGGAHAAKPHAGGGQVDDGIVDAAAAKGDGGQHLGGKRLVRQ